MPTLICRSLRNKVYTLALSKITIRYPFMCIAIKDSLQDLGLKEYTFDSEIINSFYEFIRLKPKDAGRVWFDESDIESRVKLLTKCIKQTS